MAAIAFDSQMAGIGLIDEDFQPVARFDSWLDMRCQPYIEQMDSEAGDRITQLTGCPPTCDHGPKMLWWKHEQPGGLPPDRQVRHARRLRGREDGRAEGRPGLHRLHLHPLLRVCAMRRRGAWSEELCERFGLDMDKLPADRRAVAT